MCERPSFRTFITHSDQAEVPAGRFLKVAVDTACDVYTIWIPNGDETHMTASDAKPPDGGIVLAITFQYYRDLPRAMAFYEDVLGFELAIDQGWSKIYRIDGQAHVGLVDETRGMQNWAEDKTVQLCLRVPDVDAWYGWVQSRKVDGLSKMFDSAELGIRAFAMNDPEGYQIEVQTAQPGH